MLGIHKVDCPDPDELLGAHACCPCPHCLGTGWLGADPDDLECDCGAQLQPDAEQVAQVERLRSHQVVLYDGGLGLLRVRSAQPRSPEADPPAPVVSSQRDLLEVQRGWLEVHRQRPEVIKPPPSLEDFLAHANRVQAAHANGGAPEDLRAQSRDQRQGTITRWARAAFGEEEATDLRQRGVRLLEEAIEAFQACGGDAAIAHKLVAFVFDRPPGEIGQELGGVAVTVLGLAAAAGLSADEEECREIHRVLSKPIEEFTQRNARKNAAGFRIVGDQEVGAAPVPALRVVLRDGRIFEGPLCDRHYDAYKREGWLSLAVDHVAHPEIPEVFLFEECACVVDVVAPLVNLLPTWRAAS